jgi:hypothetical protein
MQLQNTTIFRAFSQAPNQPRPCVSIRPRAVLDDLGRPQATSGRRNMYSSSIGEEGKIDLAILLSSTTKLIFQLGPEPGSLDKD